MNKVAHYLQEHLLGEVMTSTDARRYFSHDASIFAVPPAVVVYPRSENDIRKTTRFTWQLAERGRAIPLTARGAGTDQGGAAIGPGIAMVLPAHMNRILELDGKSGNVVIEPGINFGKLQQTLQTHSRFLPPYPASMEYSTVGGAIANNAGGEKSIKYGTMRDYVKSLRVVLANGEVIETRRLSKRELSKKLGLGTFEGEIYRSLDTLIEENHELIKGMSKSVTKNAAGYDLVNVKRKDGFDLTPLFVGSQGTLGVITEATLRTAVYNPHSTLIVAFFDDLQVAEEVIVELRKLPEMPCAIEVVDDRLLNFVQGQNPNQLKGVLEPPFPALTMLVEFDSAGDRVQRRLAKKAAKILGRYQVPYRVETDPQRKDELWKLRHSTAAILWQADGGTRAVPVIEDGIVPVEGFKEHMQAIYQLFQKYGLQPAVWGHAGDGHLHVQPMLDLAQVGDRQKLFRLMDEYYSLVIAMGGSTTGQHNDGRLRGPYLPKLYGPEVYNLFVGVKKIFDPYGTLNAGVKVGVDLDMIKPLLRQEYDLGHLYQHMPRS